MRVTKITCDVCGRESTDESEICAYQMLVLRHYIDEYGSRHNSYYEIMKLDLCKGCLDKSVVLEADTGLDCAIPNEDEARFRQLGEE